MAQSVIQTALQFSMRAGVVGAVVVGTVQNCLFTVDGGEAAIKFDRIRGIMEDEFEDGTHLIVPILQKPIVFDVRTHAHKVSSSTLTKDQQEVKIGVRVLYTPVRGELKTLYDTYGEDYAERVLPSIVKEEMKRCVGQYDARELLTKRSLVSRMIEESLKDRAQDFWIKLQDVSITELTYGSDFSRAIEQKQVAEQDAERAKFVVQMRDQEGKARVIEAEAEAEAAKLLQAAFQDTGTGVIQLRKIEACADIAETLARSRNVVYLPPGGRAGGGGSGGGSNILLGINPQ